MTISTEIDMKKLCDKDSAKEYYNNLPVPRFEIFFTYEEGGQTGWYYDTDTITTELEHNDDTLMSAFVLNNSDPERVLLKVSTCRVGKWSDASKPGEWWTKNDGKILFGYMKDDCYAIDTFNEAQSQAFSNTCSNYRQIVERQAEELEDMRKKLMESMELMIKMDKVIKEHSENNIPNEVVEEYFLSEIEGRIIKEEEINFLTKNNSLERCIKNACDNSEYDVKCKCLCEAHKTIWVELSEDGE